MSSPDSPSNHQIANGVSEEDAYRHFEEWAEEDTYQPLEDELAAWTAAGFDAECVFQAGPMTVVVARKP